MSYLTVPDLVEILDSTPGKIRRLIEDNALAAVRIDGVLQIPEAFVNNGAPVPSLRGTITLLQDLGFDNDEIVDWLLSDNDELGERPIDALRRGAKSTVRRAAQLEGTR